MEWFLHSSSTSGRLARTLVEVALSWLIANLGDIFGLFTMNPTLKALLISGLTMVFTAILGFIHDGKEAIKEDNDEDAI